MSMPAFQFAWPPLTPAIKALLITFGAAFLIHPILSTSLGFGDTLEPLLYLSNQGMFSDLYLWQPLTYQLLHDGFIHLFFNALVLYFIGSFIEPRWGALGLLRNMLICGLGGAAVILLSNLGWDLIADLPLTEGPRTVGASAGISGLLAAFALYTWDQPIRLFFTLQVKGKWTLAIFAGMDVVSALLGQPISVAGHLGGMLTGFILTVLLYDPNRWLPRFKIWRLRRRMKTLTGDDKRKPPTLH